MTMAVAGRLSLLQEHYRLKRQQQGPQPEDRRLDLYLMLVHLGH